MIFVFCEVCAALNIVYGASLQLKSVYTKHRMGVTTTGDPVVFASRPPYNDGWMWTIEPDEENASLARGSVACRAAVSLYSTVAGAYLSVVEDEVVALPSNEGAASQWVVDCESGTAWDDDVEVSLMNVGSRCYLSTSFEGDEGKFRVSCGQLAKGSIWKAAEGIYFSEHGSTVPQPESEVRSDEL